MSRSFFVTLPL